MLAGNTLLLAGLAVVGWRNREVPGGREFAALQGVSVVWAGLTLLGIRLPAGASRLLVWRLSTAASLVTVPLWLGFILSYTGREAWLRPVRSLPATFPLAVGAVLYVVGPVETGLVTDHTQITTPSGTLVDSTIAPLGSVVGAYLYAVFLVGLLVVARTVFEGDRLFRRQAVALAAGTLVTVFASALEIAGIPSAGYPITEVALGGQSLLWGYAAFGGQFLQFVPAVGHVGQHAVFENLDDWVLVVDRDGMVIRANETARDRLSVDRVVGKPVDDVLDLIGAGGIEELPARFRHRGRACQAQVSPVRNWRGKLIGSSVLVSDVTELMRGQQRLQVLNRILRHNVSNDVNVILGMADQIGEDDQEEVSNAISAKAKDLVKVSEKALEVEKHLGRELVVESVDLQALVVDVVDPLAGRHDHDSIAVDVGNRRLATDREVLSLVLEEVVENALVHAGPTPRVRIEVSETEAGLELRVEDDGPGIPTMEIDPIDSGEETSLQHASSLGLWLIHWGANALGGEVRFDTNGGTTVTLSMPDLRNRPTRLAGNRSE
ncbi:MAG: histidine kinase N-terminal 7TM domain-containing protein [Halobacteriales archaeon]